MFSDNKGIMSFFSLLFLFISVWYSLKGIDAEGVKNSFSFMAFIILLSSSRKALWIIGFPLILFYALYFPIGAIYGAPTTNQIAAFIATDISEAKEFFFSLRTINYLYSVIIVFSFICYRKLSVKFNLMYFKNKSLLILMSLVLMSSSTVIDGPKSMLKSAREVHYEYKKLIEMTSDVSQWKVSGVNNKYNVYVLIIGESASKNYHHVYGYPLNNTPFLSSVNGVFIDGLTSGDAYTIGSLRLMLTKPDKNQILPNYNLSIIQLANKAGFNTAWISNQGYLGTHDTPISTIANQADFKYFLKLGGYDSKNTDDDLMIPVFNEYLNDFDKNKANFIVIHLYGSHPYVCDRLHGFKSNLNVSDSNYKSILCYVDSIQKTDLFLSKIKSSLDDKLKKHGISYSMVYFSDHGLSHVYKDGSHIITHNPDDIGVYEIPLVKISSDDEERISLNVKKSAMNFTEGLAKWMGIDSELIDKNIDLFDDENHSDKLIDIINKKKREEVVNISDH
ncbi:phosphoethanolamine transferase [Morganella morganii]|uniref:phosphoethanolamine transferase n=1 Tax=Morganella morganii TaxID=582 RepID=UPI0018975A91|nr:phosphoethanolamine transferase [Morganella morganii]